MRSRRNGRLAVAAGVLGLAAMTVVAGCAPVTSDVADASAVSPERFYSQQLTWEECDDYATTDGDAEVLAVVGVARCARLAVPLDYEEPDGPEAAVAVLRIPARGEALGSLVTNPGGPGRSGVIGAVAAAGGLVRSSITERFDVVGFDPRGVGATVPAVDCYSDTDADTGSVALGPSGTTESLTSDRVRELVERCAEGSGGPDALAHMAPGTPPATWTCCAPRSATTGSPSSGRATAPGSVRSTPSSSPATFAR